MRWKWEWKSTTFCCKKDLLVEVKMKVYSEDESERPFCCKRELLVEAQRQLIAPSSALLSHGSQFCTFIQNSNDKFYWNKSESEPSFLCKEELLVEAQKQLIAPSSALLSHGRHPVLHFYTGSTSPSLVHYVVRSFRKISSGEICSHFAPIFLNFIILDRMFGDCLVWYIYGDKFDTTMCRRTICNSGRL